MQTSEGVPQGAVLTACLFFLFSPQLNVFEVLAVVSIETQMDFQQICWGISQYVCVEKSRAAVIPQAVI